MNLRSGSSARLKFIPKATNPKGLFDPVADVDATLGVEPPASLGSHVKLE
jgi:hypothetical protein